MKKLIKKTVRHIYHSWKKAQIPHIEFRRGFTYPSIIWLPIYLIEVLLACPVSGVALAATYTQLYTPLSWLSQLRHDAFGAPCKRQPSVKLIPKCACLEEPWSKVNKWVFTLIPMSCHSITVYHREVQFIIRFLTLSVDILCTRWLSWLVMHSTGACSPSI